MANSFIKLRMGSKAPSVCRVLAAISLTLAFVPAAAADAIPGTPYSGANYYFTADQTKITVNFGLSATNPDETTKRIRKTLVSAKISRSYINWAIGYRNSEFASLPLEISVHRIMLIMRNSDGAPFSLAIKAARAKPEARESPLMIAKRLRPDIDFVTILPTINDPYKFPKHPGKYAYTSVENEDGLIEYIAGPNGPMYYSDPTVPYLIYVTCMKSLERTRPFQFCDYRIALSRHLFAKVSFQDFRFHGGRRYLTERLNRTRENLCRFLPCDDGE